MEAKDLLFKLKNLLKEAEVNSSQLALQDIEDSFIEQIQSELGKFELAFGPERTKGSGDYDGAQAVYHFSDHDVYISIQGCYSSEGGMDFDGGMYVVEPVQVTTTVYKVRK